MFSPSDYSRDKSLYKRETTTDNEENKNILMFSDKSLAFPRK